jgi:hypothetical protein
MLAFARRLHSVSFRRVDLVLCQGDVFNVPAVLRQITEHASYLKSQWGLYAIHEAINVFYRFEQVSHSGKTSLHLAKQYQDISLILTFSTTI